MRHRRRRRQRSLSPRTVVLALVVAVLGVWFARSYVAVPFTVPTRSMADTLRPGDRILVDRLGPHLRGVQRGDVVVFDGTDAFGSPDTDFVKRVIGIGGDRVTCCDRRGRLTVNGAVLDERDYVHDGERASQLRFDIRVPEGRLWVMGDHRSNSMDSRAHLGSPGGGTVAVDDLVGRVVGVMWPPSRIGALS